MDAKSVIEILKDLKSTEHPLALIAESKVKKQTLLASIGFWLLFILLAFINQPYAALFSAASALLFLIVHTIAGALQSKKFLLNPIGEYIKSLQLGLQRERKVIFDLRPFTIETLAEVKDNLEFEIKRINMNTAMMIGATEKLGIFSGLIALLFGISKVSGENEFVSQLLLGFVIGLYIGVSQAKRILSWLILSVFVLDQSIKNREQEISTSMNAVDIKKIL